MDINFKEIDVYVTDKSSYYGKHQTVYAFPNGYGASVIHGEHIRDFEIAPLLGDAIMHDEVTAGLDTEGVYKMLDKIKNR